MISHQEYSIRQVTKQDAKDLKRLIRSEQMVHKHLDWRTPLERINESPFLIMQKSNRIIGALACPQDPQETAWVQFFLTVSGESVKTTWPLLFEKAALILNDSSARNIMAIPIFPWFSNLLIQSGFYEVSRVITLNLDVQNFNLQLIKPDILIRDMQISDIGEVEILDRESFGPIWNNSQRSLEAAFLLAFKATVALIDNTIIGYQISTTSGRNTHLARIAVSPEYQKRGVGSGILLDLIVFLKANSKSILSVNTQKSNINSSHLYEKFGFQITEESFPVYGFKLNKN